MRRLCLHARVEHSFICVAYMHAAQQSWLGRCLSGVDVVMRCVSKVSRDPFLAIMHSVPLHHVFVCSLPLCMFLYDTDILRSVPSFCPLTWPKVMIAVMLHETGWIVAFKRPVKRYHLSTFESRMVSASLFLLSGKMVVLVFWLQTGLARRMQCVRLAVSARLHEVSSARGRRGRGSGWRSVRSYF